MPVAGNVNDVSAADYAPPPSTAATRTQSGLGDWFAQNAPAKSTQKVSIKTPEKPKAATSHADGDAYLKRHGTTGISKNTPVQTSTPLVGAGSAVKAVLPTVAGYATGYAGRAAGLPDWANVPLSIAAGILTGHVTEPSSPAEPQSKPRSSAALTRPYSSELANSRRVAEPEPEPEPVEKPKQADPKNNPPNPRKVAPKATVPVEGTSEAEQRADFERAQANMADRAKNGPKRKTPPWASRPLADRAKLLRQQQEAAAKPKATPIPEPKAASVAAPPQVVAPPPQPEGSLGLQERPEGQTEVQRPSAVPVTPPKPVGSLGLQEAVENPVPVETPKPTAEPVKVEEEKEESAPVEQKARDGKAGSEESRPAEGQRVWEYGDPTPSPKNTVRMKTADLHADPARFQYKGEAIGKGGTTDEFRSVKKWNEDAAGTVHVWLDPADGKAYVTNGHHRLEMASRIGQPDLAVRFIDAPDATTARTRSALTNIAEGKGTAIDAAKIFRDSGITPEEAEAQHGISPEGKISKNGMALSGLSDRAFQKVVDGDLLESHGAVIGEKLRGQTETQNSLIDWLKKQKVRYNASMIGDIAEKWKRFEQEHIHSDKPVEEKDLDPQQNMFGAIDEDVMQQNYFGEQAQVQDEIRQKLSSDKRLFGLLGKESVGKKVGAQGKNVIDVSGNQTVAQKAAQILEVYQKLVNKTGPMEKIIFESARKMAGGMSKEDAAADAYPKIAAEIERVLNPGTARAK